MISAQMSMLVGDPNVVIVPEDVDQEKEEENHVCTFCEDCVPHQCQVHGRHRFDNFPPRYPDPPERGDRSQTREKREPTERFDQTKQHRSSQDHQNVDPQPSEKYKSRSLGWTDPEEEEAGEQIAKLRSLKDKNSQASWLQRLLDEAGLDGNAASVARAVKSRGGSLPVLKGIQCPAFSKARQEASTWKPTYYAPWSQQHMPGPSTGRAPSKDIVKLVDFSGGKGFGSPDDADAWLRNLSRAVNINRWSPEEAFEHVQGKLVGAAAVWYRNRENQFHCHPRGVEVGWKAFWSAFEQKFVAQDEQALWNQFEQRVQQPDESVEMYADALRSMADHLGANINGGNVCSRFLKGLASPHVRSKVEAMMYLLPGGFDELEAAASFQEKTVRREKSGKSSKHDAGREVSTAHIVGPSTEPSGGNVVGGVGVSEMQRLLEDSLAKHQKLMEESIQKHILELKKKWPSRNNLWPEIILTGCGSLNHLDFVSLAMVIT